MIDFLCIYLYLVSINIIKNITGLGNTKHIDVELGETECVIDLGLVVNYGIKISETILKFQELAKKNIEDLIQFMNIKDIPFLVKASIVHFFFEYIHPFYDGNGRFGRYLLSLYLAN